MAVDAPDVVPVATANRVPTMTPQQEQTAANIVNEQAEDEGLWFEARTMPEAYLQQELRRLHAAIEAAAAPSPDALRAALAGPPLDISNPYRSDTLSWVTFEQGVLAAQLFLRALAATPSPSSGLDVDRLQWYEMRLTAALNADPFVSDPLWIMRGDMRRDIARLQEQER